MIRDKSYHESLIEALKDPEEAAAYLTAALEEGDPDMFAVALSNVIEARQDMPGGRPDALDLDRIKASLLDGPAIFKLRPLLGDLGLTFQVIAK